MQRGTPWHQIFLLLPIAFNPNKTKLILKNKPTLILIWTCTLFFLYRKFYAEASPVVSIKPLCIDGQNHTKLPRYFKTGWHIMPRYPQKEKRKNACRHEISTKQQELLTPRRLLKNLSPGFVKIFERWFIFVASDAASILVLISGVETSHH